MNYVSLAEIHVADENLQCGTKRHASDVQQIDVKKPVISNQSLSEAANAKINLLNIRIKELEMAGEPNLTRIERIEKLRQEDLRWLIPQLTRLIIYPNTSKDKLCRIHLHIYMYNCTN